MNDIETATESVLYGSQKRNTEAGDDEFQYSVFQELGGEDSFEEMSGVVEGAPVMAGGHQGARLRHVG